MGAEADVNQVTGMRKIMAMQPTIYVSCCRLKYHISGPEQLPVRHYPTVWLKTPSKKSITAIGRISVDGKYDFYQVLRSACMRRGVKGESKSATVDNFSGIIFRGCYIKTACKTRTIFFRLLVNCQHSVLFLLALLRNLRSNLN